MRHVPIEVAVAELGNSINEADRMMTGVSEQLIAAAPTLPIETRLAFAQVLLLGGIATVIESVLGEELADDGVPVPEVPPVDVELREDPMTRDEPVAPPDLQPEPLPWVPRDGGPDVTVLLDVDELIAVCRDDVEACVDAGKVEVPAAWEELQRRAGLGDQKAAEFVAAVQEQAPSFPEGVQAERETGDETGG